MTDEFASPETDPRFPSGKWVGFFLESVRPPERYEMELDLVFREGEMTGDGRDRVGRFLVRGRYSLEDGSCRFTKQYVGQHEVFYHGYNEGKGIWGVWEIPADEEYEASRGGFHIWPEGMPDPTGSVLIEEAEQPDSAAKPITVTEPVFARLGAGERLQ